MLLLVGIAADDEPADVDWLCKKICNMRIFNDQEGKMNLSLLDVQGDLLSISQFTLHASTKKEIVLHLFTLQNLNLPKNVFAIQ